MKPAAFYRLVRTGSPAACLLATAIAALITAQAAHAATFVWANSNVTGTPASPLNWFNSPQGAWTGGTPLSGNTNTIQFFQDVTTALGNTGGTGNTQISAIDNGGSAFELGTLTLSGLASTTTGANLAMTISGDALNFSGATGTINLDALNNTRTLTYNINSNIQLGTSISAGALTLAGNGTGTFNIGGIISELQVGGGSLTKTGSSTVTLTGANTYTGATTVNSGTLSLTGAIDSSSALKMGGGTFSYSKAGTNTQTINGLTVNPGGSVVSNTVATDTLNLGGISRAAGNGTVSFATTTGAITTSASNVNNIIGPWATIGSGTSLKYAVSNGGSSSITGLTGSAAGTNLVNVTDNTANYDYTGAVTTAVNLTGNTLRFSGAAAATTIGATNTLTLNGLLNAGSGDLTISGGPSTGGIIIGATQELVITGNNKNTIINTKIADNPLGASKLVFYSGTSAAQLNIQTSGNTYSGGTIVNGGTLWCQPVGAQMLGTGTVTLNQATLSSNGGSITHANAFVLNGATISSGDNGFIFTGPVTLIGNNILNPANYNGNADFRNTISGTGGITLTGGGGVSTPVHRRQHLHWRDRDQHRHAATRQRQCGGKRHGHQRHH